jgi:hypothetical protein
MNDVVDAEARCRALVLLSPGAEKDEGRGKNSGALGSSVMCAGNETII